MTGVQPSNSSIYTGQVDTNFQNQGTGEAVQTLAQYAGGNYATVPNNEPTSNLPFDVRIHRIRHILNSNIVTSGAISSASLAPGANGQTYTAYFLFNPTEIDLEYNFDSTVTGAINPIYDGDPSNVDPQGLMLNQTQSFTLLFDRTYELWTGRNAPDYGNYQNGGPYNFGVQWDVWAIERLVGIYGQAAGKGPSGPPAANICTVKFGGALPAGENLGATPGYVAFNGWMTGLEVEYTRFDANMTPTRAAVSLTFEQIYSLPAIYTSSPNTGSSDPSLAAGASAITTAVGNDVNNAASALGSAVSGVSQFTGSF